MRPSIGIGSSSKRSPQITQTKKQPQRGTKGTRANPGAFVKIYIDGGKERSSVKVPTNCIIPDDKNNQVILVKNGKASFVNIQTGVREANIVEVTKGIDVGDSIVVTGVLFARPDAKLKVREVKKITTLSTP